MGEETPFQSYAPYKVTRKHYDDDRWVKLKRVLGSALVSFSFKLLVIVKGEPNTRKLFLASLLVKTEMLVVTSLRNVS